MVNISLGSLFKVSSGDSIAIGKLSTYGLYPVYGGNGISGYSSNFNVPPDTLIIGRVGEKCGNVTITAKQSWISDNALIVTKKVNCSNKYLMYLLEHINLNAYANRNAQPVISGNIIYKINAPYCEDIVEQEAIAKTIAAFDTHISNLAALIEKKRAIRDAALEDLVSGRTRLAGFSGKEAESVPLGAIQEVKRGRRLVRSQLYERGMFPVFQNSLAPLGYYNESNCPPKSAFVIAAGNAGDIGFSETAFWAADDCYYFEHSEKLRQKFLYYSLLYKQADIYAQTRRTSIPRLSRDILDGIVLLIPSAEEQDAIAEALTAMDDEINSLEAERDKMTQIREGVMDDLLTGRKRLNQSHERNACVK